MIADAGTIGRGAPLEVKLQCEGFAFFTHGRTGFVMLERALPETVINSCVGVTL